jgi:DNA-binding SARP family transcriptional activator
VTTEFRVLGPLEAVADGRPVRLSPRPRSVLAVLLLHPGQVVPVTRLIDGLWGERPPETATNVVQGYVSQLRKSLGRNLVETRDPGYLLRVEHDSFDLLRFERLATDGARSLESGHPEEAAALLREALALWRGDALSDVAEGDVLRPAAARLDELRLVALERRVEADLACGRERELVAELEAFAAQHPLRERPQGLLMQALYRCGRQADALEVYRTTRTRLVDELGLDPGAELQELERAILRHDPVLDGRATAAPERRGPAHTILVAALELSALGRLVSLAELLARGEERAIVLSSTVADAGALTDASARLREERERLLAAGLDVRAAAFTSLTPGADLARVAREQDAELLLVDAPERLLEDSRLLSLLDDAPCDVGVLVRGEARAGPVLVPFVGAEHDWSAVELGAWIARGQAGRLVLAGSAVGAGGRDASRLLASASLAVQRALGVDAEPLLVEPSPQALVDAARDAGLVVVGLTDRWRREGVGRTRTALAASPHHPTLLVRRGLRPGGLAPRSSETRFTWTIGPAGR